MLKSLTSDTATPNAETKGLARFRIPRTPNIYTAVK